MEFHGFPVDSSPMLELGAEFSVWFFKKLFFGIVPITVCKCGAWTHWHGSLVCQIIGSLDRSSANQHCTLPWFLLLTVPAVYTAQGSRSSFSIQRFGTGGCACWSLHEKIVSDGSCPRTSSLHPGTKYWSSPKLPPATILVQSETIPFQVPKTFVNMFSLCKATSTTPIFHLYIYIYSFIYLCIHINIKLNIYIYIYMRPGKLTWNPKVELDGRCFSFAISWFLGSKCEFPGMFFRHP